MGLSMARKREYGDSLSLSLSVDIEIIDILYKYIYTLYK